MKRETDLAYFWTSYEQTKEGQESFVNEYGRVEFVERMELKPIVRWPLRKRIWLSIKAAWRTLWKKKTP